ncbi:ABC transporter permease [Streptomyces chrestomyceticus JCM 4735]|uniref:ABC transporter permease n=2 Tax=Streptomyces chrestomyceticus TaxID=68185 RepID=A0A7U9KQH1_9ACTN|nr:ABC transporter permease [Streptomyces chrestomyceticus JCM 4735]
MSAMSPTSPPLAAPRISPTRLLWSEVRAYPGRVIGAAAACCATAAGVGACLLLLLGAGLDNHPADSPEAAAAQGAQQIMGLLMSMLLLCAVLVTGSTLSLWTGQRLRQFAVLRALGTTAARLRLMVAADVARLALVSAAAGAATGALPLAALGRRLLIEQQLWPAGTSLPPPAQTWGACAAVCLGTGAIGVLAALLSVRAAGRVNAIDLLKDHESAPGLQRSRARLITGLSVALLFCAPLLPYMALAPLSTRERAAAPTVLAVLVIPTLAVLAPWIIPPLTRPLCAVLRVLDRRVGALAAAGLRATPARTAALAVPVLLAVGITACLLGAGATMGRATQQEVTSALRADAVISAEPGVRLPASPGPLPGATATPVVATQVTVPGRKRRSAPKPIRAWGVDGRVLTRVLDLSAREGDLTKVAEGTFAAGATFADEAKWKIGQSVDLTLADGTTQRSTLVATYTRDLAFPRMILPRATALAHTASPAADRIFLTGPSSAWPAAKGQTVASREDYARTFTRNPGDDLATRLIVAVVAAYALLAAANTSSLAQRDRVAQRAHLRALGLSRLQMVRCVLYEALGGGAVGAVLSGLVAVVCLVPLSVALGLGPLPAVDVPWTAGVLALAAVALGVPALMTAHPLLAVQRQFARRGQ